jgi:hypothetical protein
MMQLKIWPTGKDQPDGTKQQVYKVYRHTGHFLTAIKRGGGNAPPAPRVPPPPLNHFAPPPVKVPCL